MEGDSGSPLCPRRRFAAANASTTPPARKVASAVLDAAWPQHESLAAVAALPNVSCFNELMHVAPLVVAVERRDAAKFKVLSVFSC